MAVGAVFVLLAWVVTHPLVLVPVAGLAGTGFLVLSHTRGQRRVAAEDQRRRELYERSFLEAVDVMSGPQFEEYVAGLLRLDGCTDVRLVGGPGDGGADILAIDPSGRPMAIQCKRQLAPVPVSIIRQLIGSLAHEHPGRSGVLVTTAQLTKPATQLADSAGIIKVDRQHLASWMATARQRIGPQTTSGVPPLHQPGADTAGAS